MATRKAASLEADLIARKGEATPALPPTPPTAEVPHGTKDTIALTVRLGTNRYPRLVAYAAGFVPRKTHQDILVNALDAYLDQETWASTHAWTTRALNPSAIIIVSLVLLVTKAVLTSAALSRPTFMAAGGDAQRRCEAVMRVAAKDAANAAMPKLFEMTRRMLTRYTSDVQGRFQTLCMGIPIMKEVIVRQKAAIADAHRTGNAAEAWPLEEAVATHQQVLGKFERELSDMMASRR
jgi:hypothetical protein